MKMILTCRSRRISLETLILVSQAIKTLLILTVLIKKNT